ncbi:MAG: TRAP transporter small permease [Lawsonibacter sp.]|nr:TRAP transporter small permease [Lawsonibacter sp.]
MKKKFWTWLDQDLEECILMLLLVAIAVVMMAQVVMRYCFRQSMSWPEEFCRFCFVYSGFLSIGYCVRRGKMLKVDILVGFFPKKLQEIVDVIGQLVTLIFFAYMTYYAFGTTQSSIAGGMKSPALELPLWILYASVFFGCALGVIRQTEELFRLFFHRRSAKKMGGPKC